jgi:transcription elongation GreA/GreB family factor
MTSPSSDKDVLRAELRTLLERARDKLLAAHETSTQGVTHDDARSEGSKDTRATSASYIARGQALRVEALAADVAKVAAMRLRAFGATDPVAMSALVTVVDDDGIERRLFVAPAGGGMVLTGGVSVTTPASPLGAALIGAVRGDVVAFDRGGRTLEVELVSVG